MNLHLPSEIFEDAEEEMICIRWGGDCAGKECLILTLWVRVLLEKFTQGDGI